MLTFIGLWFLVALGTAATYVGLRLFVEHFWPAESVVLERGAAGSHRQLRDIHEYADREYPNHTVWLSGMFRPGGSSTATMYMPVRWAIVSDQDGISLLIHGDSGSMEPVPAEVSYENGTVRYDVTNTVVDKASKKV